MLLWVYSKTYISRRLVWGAVGGLNLSSILKTFAMLLWVYLTHRQLKGKLGTCVVSLTKLRHPFFQLTSLQDSAYTLALQSPHSCFSEQKEEVSFRVLTACITAAEQFCTWGPWGKAIGEKGEKWKTHSQMCCLFKFWLHTTMGLILFPFNNPQVIVFVCFAQSF